MTATISDHLPQFAIFGNSTGNKCDIYKGDWSIFDWENFILVGGFVENYELNELNADN